MDSVKKVLRTVIIVGLVCAAVACAVVFGINTYVKVSVADSIISVDEASRISGVECVLVLGCQVRPDGTPSPMLKDRLNKGVELYESGVAPKMLLSGDNGTVFYNELETMRQEVLNDGVAGEDIFADYAGFSTYDSMYRARDVFRAKKIIIVTQKYHLYRAIYIARKLGLEAYGVAAAGNNYRGQRLRDCREILARDKDFFKTMFNMKPKYLGDPVSISGKGNGAEDND